MQVPTKLPKRFENPVDAQLARLALRAVPLCVSAGITPNIVTLVGIVLRVQALVAFNAHDATHAMVYWGLAYFMDVLDGILARSTGQVTAFGDWLDHLSDTASLMCLLFMCGDRVYHGKHVWPLLLAVPVMLLSSFHLVCQERYAKTNSGPRYQDIELLKVMPFTCNQFEGKLPWSRLFGVGTAHLLYMFLIQYYAR